MKIESNATSGLAAELQGHATTTYNLANIMLMALEGKGRHAIEAGHEAHALTELAYAVRNSAADAMKVCGLYDSLTEPVEG